MAAIQPTIDATSARTRPELFVSRPSSCPVAHTLILDRLPATGTHDNVCFAAPLRLFLDLGTRVVEDTKCNLLQ